MVMAEKGIQNIPPEWCHDLTLADKDGNTVAMILASKGVQNIPTIWRHNQTLTNNRNYTVAMKYASNGIIPPPEWHHDPYL